MEQFKAVEKEMKTKAYSKEGLSAASRLDPKEKEKADACDFLSNMVDELQQKIEAMEAEEETLHASLKKGKKDPVKTNRMDEISRVTERHKWHVNKLEFLLRALQNGGVDTAQVVDLKDSIKYYVEDGHNIDYSGEDETLYDDLNLGDEEGQVGGANDNDHGSSQDTQSIPDEEPEPRGKPKADSVSGRRPSTQMKSPLPVLATINSSSTPSTTSNSMKPAPLPTRLPGETLKYASAAAAAAASDRSGVGIAPLPPPPGSSPASSSVLPVSKAGSTTYSPGVTSAPLASRIVSTPEPTEKPSRLDSPAPAQVANIKAASSTPAPQSPAAEKREVGVSKAEAPNGSAATKEGAASTSQEQSVYHLPPGLQDLIQSFEATKSRGEANSSSASVQRLLAASLNSCPEPGDAEKPRHYKPQNPYNTPLYYPQEPLPIFDDHRLYDTGRIDTDTLFYIFYYQQGTYQQYLAAKSLKNQSWRFHKQYQTWFQRHEEPKMITEEFEQGTYRFFDYESTW